MKSLGHPAKLSGLYVPQFIQPEDVIRVLNAAEICFTLVGAHGLGGWTGTRRARSAVDVVVRTKHVKKASAALTAAFPDLDVTDAPLVVRLRNRDMGAAVINLLKPAPSLVLAALRNTRTVRSGRLTYKVPSLEMALALTFDRIVSVYRDDVEKVRDAADFGRMVRRHADVNWRRLSALGDQVIAGGGRALVATVRRVRAGERLIRRPFAESPL